MRAGKKKLPGKPPTAPQLCSEGPLDPQIGTDGPLLAADGQGVTLCGGWSRKSCSLVSRGLSGIRSWGARVSSNFRELDRTTLKKRWLRPATPYRQRPKFGSEREKRRGHTLLAGCMFMRVVIVCGSPVRILPPDVQTHRARSASDRYYRGKQTEPEQEWTRMAEPESGFIEAVHRATEHTGL